MTKKHTFQFYFFSGYLLLQTIFLRYVYFTYGRQAYKSCAWIAMSLLLIVLLYLVHKNKWGVKDLGIRLDNIQTNVVLMGMITIVFAVALLLLNEVLQRPSVSLEQFATHFLGVFLISSFAQEFIFRGYLLKLQQGIFTSKTRIIVINGLLFGLMHTMVISEPLYFTFLGTSLLGMAWACAYLKNPNLIQVTISHAILNFLVAYLGFFSFKG